VQNFSSNRQTVLKLIQMATGPDGLTLFHLKYLGTAGIGYLTDLFNFLVKVAVVPAIGKAALILPILKPGMPADQGTSYRPISLLCPAIKISETFAAYNYCLSVARPISTWFSHRSFHYNLAASTGNPDL
jgi:hypothetical protein